MPGRRIVLLDMATEDAEEFVRLVDGVSEVSCFERDSGEERHFAANVEAVVARPTVWCKCDVPTESRSQRRRRVAAKREGGWSRGARFGWWLCARCRKPSKAVVQHWITSMLVGANDLLPQILGTGSAIPPSQRWVRDGGVANPHEDVSAQYIPQRYAPAKPVRKARRSAADAQAALRRAHEAIRADDLT